MKKKYEKPQMRAIEINTEQTILAMSDAPQVQSNAPEGDWDWN